MQNCFKKSFENRPEKEDAENFRLSYTTSNNTMSNCCCATAEQQFRLAYFFPALKLNRVLFSHRCFFAFFFLVLELISDLCLPRREIVDPLPLCGF